MKFRPAVLLSALALAAGAAHAAPDAKAPAAPDAVLLEAARAARPALEQSLVEMTTIESGTSDTAGLLAFASYLEKRLSALGAKTQMLPLTQGDSKALKATLTGTGQRRIMLMAHMDTIYPANTIKTSPIRKDGNRLYGPGIADDKGGIALILHALQILHDAGWKNYAQITVLLNPDEEITSPGSSKLIAEEASTHDVVLSFEPSGPTGGFLSLATSGTAVAHLEVEGKASHAGAAPKEGRNALIELTHQLLQTRDVDKSVPDTQLNWTVAKAGVVHNQIPQHAQAEGDVRVKSADGIDKLEAALRKKIGESSLVPDTKVTLRMEKGHPTFVATAQSYALANKANDIYAEVGQKLSFRVFSGGSTDASWAAQSGKAVVLESLGLGGAGYHGKDEHVVLDSIVPRLYLATRILQEIGQNWDMIARR